MITQIKTETIIKFGEHKQKNDTLELLYITLHTSCKLLITCFILSTDLESLEGNT